MPYEHKENTGRTFKEEEKKDPKHADFQGTANIFGVEVYMNSFYNPPKDGKKANFRHTFKPTRKGEVTLAALLKGASSTEREPAPKQPDFDDDIPF